MDLIKFTDCKDSEISRVILFCNKNGFTPRSLEDWRGGDIQAALAWEEDKLVGACPFFVRKISEGRNKRNSLCGYFTSVAISEEYRGQGIGSKLLKFVETNFGLDGLYVNSAKKDRAFLWYKKNGFKINSEIALFLKNINKEVIRNDIFVKELTYSSLFSSDLSSQLMVAFNVANKLFGGFEERNIDFWERKMRFHYYREYNEYFLITSKENFFQSYIIASINSYPGRDLTVDVLEFAHNKDQEFEFLLSGLDQLGRDKSIDIIRFPIDQNSYLASWLYDFGYHQGDTFSILYNSLSHISERSFPNRYFHFDYA